LQPHVFIAKIFDHTMCATEYPLEKPYWVPSFKFHTHIQTQAAIVIEPPLIK